jgi:hypothetical protein
MKMQFVAIGVVLTMLAVPVSTNAQAIGDVADDSVAGVVSGAVVGGPLGVVVAGVGGAIVGGMDDDFFTKARTLLRPSYRYSEPHCRPVPMDAPALRPSSGCWEWSHFSL